MPPPRKFRVAVKDGDMWTIHEPPHDFVLDGEGQLYVWERTLEERHELCEMLSRVGRDDVAVLCSTGLTDARGAEVYGEDLLDVILHDKSTCQWVVCWDEEHAMWNCVDLDGEWITALHHALGDGTDRVVTLGCRYEHDLEPTDE